MTIKIKGTLDFSRIPLCRRPESNRYGYYYPRDFKSRASADSATPADQLNYINTRCGFCQGIYKKRISILRILPGSKHTGCAEYFKTVKSDFCFKANRGRHQATNGNLQTALESALALKECREIAVKRRKMFHKR